MHLEETYIEENAGKINDMSLVLSPTFKAHLGRFLFLALMEVKINIIKMNF